jgi:hypothetical protein
MIDAHGSPRTLRPSVYTLLLRPAVWYQHHPRYGGQRWTISLRCRTQWGFLRGFCRLVCESCFVNFEFKGYNGAAVGKGRQLAKTELEKLKLVELSTREAVMEAARMFVSLRFPCPASVLF